MAENARGIRAGRAYVELGVNDKLTAGLRAAQQRLRTFGAFVANVGAGLIGLGTAITAPLGAAMAVFNQMGSELHDMSNRTGIAVEALSELGYAAGQTSTDLANVEVAIRRMQRTIADAAAGTKSANDSLKQIGLTLADLTGLSPEEQFALIADRINRIEDSTLRAGAAVEIFGRSGTALLPMLSELEALTAEARRLGLVMSREDAAAADAFGDALGLVLAQAKAVTFQIGRAVADAVLPYADAIQRAGAAAIAWVKENQRLVVGVAAVAAGLIAAGAALVAFGAVMSGLGAAFGLAATAVGAFGAVVGAILSPLGLAITALAGMEAVMMNVGGTGTKAIGAVGAAARWVADRVSQLSVVADLAREAFAAVGTVAADAFRGFGVLAANAAQLARGAWDVVAAAVVAPFARAREAGEQMVTAFVRTFPQLTAAVAAVAGEIREIFGPRRAVWAAALLGAFDRVAGAALAFRRMQLQVFGAVADFATGAFVRVAKAVAPIREAFETVQAIGTRVFGTVRGAIDVMADAASEGFAAIGAAAARGMAWVAGVFDGLRKGARDAFGFVAAAGGRAAELVRSAFGALGDAQQSFHRSFQGGAEAAFEAVTNGGRQLFDGLAAGFAEVADTARTAFAGIADALALGDVQLAANILWTGLQLAWVQGTEALRKTWAEFKAGFVQTAVAAFYGALDVWAKVQASLQRLWANAASAFVSVWQAAVQEVTKAFDFLEQREREREKKRIQAELAKPDLAPNAREQLERQLANVDPQAEQVLAARDRADAEAAARREKELADRLAAINAEEAALLKANADAEMALNAAASANAKRDIAALEQRKAELQQQLNELREQARSDFNPLNPSVDEAFNPLDPADLAKGVADALDGVVQKVAAVGTFNANAIRGLLGGGSAADRTAKATEKTAVATEKLARNAGRGGGLAFT